MKLIPIIFSISTLISCSTKSSGWQKVEKLDDTQCTNRKTECVTNHQGEHELTLCQAYIENDTLHIAFLAELPAYWLSTHITATDSVFSTEVDGVPFDPSFNPKYRIKKQQLRLSKPTYAIGDTLRGYVELLFEEYDDKQNYLEEFYLKGCIYKIVTTKDYNPFEDKQAFMGYDLDLAINEMGEPEKEYIFTTKEVTEFSIELLNIFPVSDSIHIRELTWNTSDDAQVSDAGIYRLTVWYAQQNGIWKPVHFSRWTTEMQF